MTITVYILMMNLTYFIFIVRLLYLWKFKARDLTITDLILSTVVSIVWPLTWLLIAWTYIDKNISGTILKGKQ